MSRRTSFLAVGGAVGCLVLVVCIGVAAFAGFSYYTTVRAMNSVDRIAYVDNTQNIQIVDGQGQHHVAITTDAADQQKGYLFPTWSPDSQHLAFVGVAGDPNSREGALDIAPAAGGSVTSVYKSQSDLPFYLYWAPDSRRIGFLAQGDTEMSLMVGTADGKENARKLEIGSPLYWSWSPDSRAVLMHVGGTLNDSTDARLSLLQWQETKDAVKFPDGPGQFLAPQFSPDGSAMLYAKTGNTDQDELFLADAKGANPKSILSYSGSVAFSWSPDGKKIATLVTPPDSDLPVGGPVFVSDASGQNRKQLTKEDALSFYWAPDGRQIAYLTMVTPGNAPANPSGQESPSGSRALSRPAPQQDAPVQLRWNVVNLDDGQDRVIATFVPTDNLIQMVPFFDQYARSITFWSPDSKHFVYAKAESDSNGSVWVVDVDGNTPPRRVGDGTLAVWSWK